MVALVGAVASPSQGAHYYEADGYYAEDSPEHLAASAFSILLGMRTLELVAGCLRVLPPNMQDLSLIPSVLVVAALINQCPQELAIFILCKLLMHMVPARQGIVFGMSDDGIFA